MRLDEMEAVRFHLAEQTGKGIRVAIIGTGVEVGHPSLGPHAVSEGIRIALNDHTVVEIPDYADDSGQGTACAAIVRKVAPDCSLLAVKVSSDENPTRPEVLAAGMDWALKHGADVISMGAVATSAEGVPSLADCCARAAQAGVVVVAAESRDGGATFPAAFPTSLVVGGEGPERSRFAYQCDPDAPRRCIAYGGFQQVAWLGGRQRRLGGTDFAVARIGGVVALILERFGRMPLHRLLDILRANAINADSLDLQGGALSDRPPASPRTIEWLKRAAIYPFTKEMHSLVRFRHLLPFELVGVADPGRRGYVGKDAGEVVGCGKCGLTITADLDEAIRDADTLIMGFTSRLDALLRESTGETAARHAIGRDKNVYSFEPFDQPRHNPLMLEAARRDVRFVWPCVDQADLDELVRSNKTSASYARTPILAVVGTSRSQGKFTLQLLLREGLMAEGFTVGQIGTEHQSMLFGMDDAFPTGHVVNVRLPPADWNRYFDLRYRQIQHDKDPDLILVGMQSGVIPSTRRDDDTIPSNISFLWTLQADSFILVVNHLDEDRLIQDTLDVLRIIGNRRTILLALSTQRKKVVPSFGRQIVVTEPVSRDEQPGHLRRLEDRFGIPALSILDESGARRMVDIVIGAFSPHNSDALR